MQRECPPAGKGGREVNLLCLRGAPPALASLLLGFDDELVSGLDVHPGSHEGGGDGIGDGLAAFVGAGDLDEARNSGLPTDGDNPESYVPRDASARAALLFRAVTAVRL